MHFHLSANAAQDLKVTSFLPNTDDNDAFAQHWYVHRVTMQRRKQYIIMEANTRYALVFCGVTKPFFEHFTDIFADTLWRHIVSLCHVPDVDWGRVKAMTSAICAENLYHKGLNRSLQAHIKDAAMQMEWRMEFGELPPVITDPGQLFEFSFFINKTPRTRHGEKQCIIPYEQFQRLWCAKLGVPAVAATINF